MKNTKYAIESRIYDSGKIEMSKPFEVDFSVNSIEKITPTYDYRLDVFLTKKEANDFYSENKFA